MKKYIQQFIVLILFTQVCRAQENIYPTPEQKGTFYITHATIHVGNGQIINDGTIKVTNGKIENVGSNISVIDNATKVFDVKGKHVYPGLISPVTNLGLREISGGVRGSNDFAEIGDINPSIRAIVAYNTDSKVINTLRSNGILLANIIPQDEEGGSNNLLTGTSSIVQLDAWNWEDAIYKMDGGMHLNMPSLLIRPNFLALFFGIQTPQVDPVKMAYEKIDRLKLFFRQAKAYSNESGNKETNLKFGATKDLFTKKQKLFIHCNAVKEMLLAIDFVTEFGFDVVIVGGSESWQIADLLKQNNIPVILQQAHSLPQTMDDDVDQPFKTPYILQKAGVLFALGDNDGTTRGRNLMFNAGTSASYGLTKEEALSAITLNAAKILGISNITGSLENGKDANIVVSEGDILDMKSSVITHAFIKGREINLTNKHTQLYERYKYKYGLK
jgi:imidazolonepropionase-like amidohydrolase